MSFFCNRKRCFCGTLLTGGTDAALEAGDLGLGGVLAQRAEELAKGLARDLARALLVKEGKGLLVLCEMRQLHVYVCATLLLP